MCEVKTILAHIKALQKLSSKAVDPAIKKGINMATKELAAEHHKLPKKGVLVTLDKVDPRSKSVVQGLFCYCLKNIKQDKPEWQIAAEANGWKPPAETN